MRIAVRRVRPIVIGLILAAVGSAAGAGAASADYRSEVLADDPFAYHRLNETSGSSSGATVMADETSGGGGVHNVVPTSQMNQVGALTTQSPNRAIRYLNTGTTQGQSFAGLPVAPLADFSLEFWVKTTQTPSGAGQWYLGHGLIDSETNGVASDFGTALMSGGKVAFGLGNPDTTITSLTSVNDGAWHHVVATRADAAMKLYIDGQLDASGSGGPTGARDGTDGFYSIADINGASTNVGLDGSMDEVALYADDLPAAAISRHFTAATAVQPPPPPPPRQITVLTNLDGGLGSGSIIGTDGLNCPTVTCGVNSPEGSVNEYVAVPAEGSRFSGFDGADCPPISENRCRVVVDDPSGVEFFSGVFHLDPETLGGELLGTFNKDAKALEKALDGSVNPKSEKKIDFEPIGLERCGCELGDLAGALAVNIPKSQVKLIGSDGATLIGSDGATLTPSATSVKGTAGLISDKGVGLIGSDGATLIGPDGATLVGNAGNTLIGNGGNTRVAPGGVGTQHRKGKSVIYALGSYGADVTEAGDITVTFVPTKSGKKIMRTFGEQNLELKRLGKKPRSLQAMYVEAIRPADGRGTGGAYKKLKIK